MANGKILNLFSRPGKVYYLKKKRYCCPLWPYKLIEVVFVLKIFHWNKIYWQCTAYRNQQYKYFYFFSDRLKLHGANVMEMDIPATNGVVQVLQSVVQQWVGALTIGEEIRTNLQILWLPLLSMHYH